MSKENKCAANADNGNQRVAGNYAGFTWEKRACLLDSMIDNQDNMIAQLKYTVEQLNDRLYDTTRKLHNAKTTIYGLHDRVNDLNTEFGIEVSFGWDEFFAMCDDDNTPPTDGGDQFDNHIHSCT